VLFGKTTTPEFAAKAVDPQPVDRHHFNPWDTSRTPGGSSGGAGAAVASGIGPMALATDAGGSIRLPASFCGVFGHKPGGGRVPMYPSTPYATLAGFGPMTRTVGDAALMMSVIAAFDPANGESCRRTAPGITSSSEADPRAWRIAWSPTLCGAVVDPRSRRSPSGPRRRSPRWAPWWRRSRKVFGDPLPTMEKFQKGLTRFAFRDMGEKQFAIMDPDLVATIRASQDASLIDHLEAEMERAALGRRMIAFHQTYDLLLTPTVGVPPFRPISTGPRGRSARAGTLHLSVQPDAAAGRQRALRLHLRRAAGRPADRGPPHRDLLVLQASYAFEQARPWRDSRRPLPTRTEDSDLERANFVFGPAGAHRRRRPARGHPLPPGCGAGGRPGRDRR